MKTNEEIKEEAQRLTTLAHRYREEHRPVLATTNVVPLPQVLSRLPDAVVTRRTLTPRDPLPHTLRRERHVEAAMYGGDVMFRLVEKETETNAVGEMVRESPAEIVMTEANGYDVLRVGYEMAEEDRLGEALVPFAARAEQSAEGASAQESDVAEVEEVLDTHQLSPAVRLRAKADIVEFLEGRLEPNLFITRAIDRQRLRERSVERLEHREELTLSIDER